MKNQSLSGLLASLIFVLLLSPAEAQSSPSKAQTGKDFQNWIKGPLWETASQQGISRPLFNAAFKRVRLNWSLPDLRPPGRRTSRHTAPRQSEFRAPGGYFKEKYLGYNISKGRAEMKKWRHTLDKIEQQYGVPREIIISIWGKETAFGAAKLPYRAIEVLATQAFMGRRKPLFKKELLAALTILQQKHIPVSSMKSAWAGALGHPQFMPTAFLKYAVDFDQDGRKNIWTSVPDALASIGNFLSQNGWQRGRNWGHEVTVPAKTPCTQAGPDQRIKTAKWRRDGVRRVDHRPFAKTELEQNSFLLMPAGRYGPAFLVSKNFYVLKTYNESDVYALFIGHVADRMQRGRRFSRKWAKIASFSRADVKEAQLELEEMGADVGGADGLIGYKTRISIGNWQRQKGQHITCFPDRAVLQRIISGE